jgi:outer membrane lipoprotein-sorting protein
MPSNNHLRQTLRELAQIRPSDDATRRALAAAHAALQSSASPRSVSRVRETFWSFLMHHRRSAAVGVLLIAALVAFLLLSSPSTSPAFAQVVDEVNRAKTVQYLETRTDIPRAGEPRGPITVSKVMILGRHRERKEVLTETPGEPLEAGHSWSRSAIGVFISDLEHGKVVSLDPKQKIFTEAKSFFSISPDDGKISETKTAPAPEVDFYGRIKEFSAEKAERLPGREIAGRTVVGFRIVDVTKRQGGADTWTRTCWVDAETNLPVQIEVTAESTVPMHGQSLWILSDIVFDEPLDESLFSTNPPEGYTVRGER